MNGLLMIVTAWVHLLSTIVWIGGIFFILYVALPVAGKTLEPGKIMGPLRGLILTPRIARLTSKGSHPEKVQKLQTMSLNLVKVSFFLGITVLLLTGMLYVYRA